MSVARGYRTTLAECAGATAGKSVSVRSLWNSSITVSLLVGRVERAPVGERHEIRADVRLLR